MQENINPPQVPDHGPNPQTAPHPGVGSKGLHASSCRSVSVPSFAWVMYEIYMFVA